MESWIAFFAISGAITLGAMSPGPSFIVVAQAALSKGRRVGFLTAIGMALAGALFALVAVLGVAALLSATPLAFLFVKVIGVKDIIVVGIPNFANGGANEFVVVKLGSGRDFACHDNEIGFNEGLTRNPTGWVLA